MDDKPMNVNFFGWIREGVKQSVIGGVSDAIEQLGTPDSQDASPQVLSFLRQDAAAKRLAAANSTTINATTTNAASRAPRKRLGKSLKEIDGTTS